MELEGFTVISEAEMHKFMMLFLLKNTLFIELVKLFKCHYPSEKYDYFMKNKIQQDRQLKPSALFINYVDTKFS